MWGALNVFGNLLLLAVLLVAAFFVFNKVKSDYQLYGNLSRPVAVLQTSYFCLYALCSYVFLDSRFSHISVKGFFFFLAIVLMVLGSLMVAFSMPFLGRRSFGMGIGGLRSSGLYQYSRNPQLVGGFIFIAGYAMLWPSWTGALWASMWLIIAHLMVRGEETHLTRVFGDKYKDYCAQTPRYLGLPKK